MIFWNFVKFLHRLDLPQVKRDLILVIKIIGILVIKIFVYDLPNDLRFGSSDISKYCESLKLE